MPAISRTAFSTAFSFVALTISQHWFRKLLGADQATSHCLKQCCLIYWCKYASLSLSEWRERSRMPSTIAATKCSVIVVFSPCIRKSSTRFIYDVYLHNIYFLRPQNILCTETIPWFRSIRAITLKYDASIYLLEYIVVSLRSFIYLIWWAVCMCLSLVFCVLIIPTTK